MWKPTESKSKKNRFEISMAEAIIHCNNHSGCNYFSLCRATPAASRSTAWSTDPKALKTIDSNDPCLWFSGRGSGSSSGNGTTSPR